MTVTVLKAYNYSSHEEEVLTQFSVLKDEDDLLSLPGNRVSWSKVTIDFVKVRPSTKVIFRIFGKWFYFKGEDFVEAADA